jgi:hypothetical protein
LQELENFVELHIRWIGVFVQLQKLIPGTDLAGCSCSSTKLDSAYTHLPVRGPVNSELEACAPSEAMPFEHDFELAGSARSWQGHFQGPSS